MFQLIAYNKENKEILDKRHYLTQPDMKAITTFCREMVKQFGLEIEVVTEEIRYVDMGQVQ